MLGDGCVVEFEPFVWGYPDEGGPCAFVVLPVDIDADVDVDVDAGAAAGFVDLVLVDSVLELVVETSD